MRKHVDSHSCICRVLHPLCPDLGQWPTELEDLQTLSLNRPGMALGVSLSGPCKNQVGLKRTEGFNDDVGDNGVDDEFDGDVGDDDDDDDVGDDGDDRDFDDGDEDGDYGDDGDCDARDDNDDGDCDDCYDCVDD